MRKIIAMCLIFAVLLSFACDKKKTLRDFKEASAKMKIYGKDLIQANIDAFKANEISRDDLEKFNRVSRRFVEAVKIYDDALKTAETVMTKNENPPRTTLDKLNIIFEEQVVAEFFRILDTLKILPNANNETIKNIIAGIRLTILAIQAMLADVRIYQEGLSYA